MPPRQLLFRIQDILDALEAIRAYTEGMEFPDFVADRRTVDAVPQPGNHRGGSLSYPGCGLRRPFGHPLDGHAFHEEFRRARIFWNQRCDFMGHRYT